ncbi:MAG: NUDIX domain-containing protein [Chitinispirillales bacterium]|jgi:8-oxo-dGTP pyrophosphatase MutT (NUDIX family)|nr:NUDIX domain-containing protein [Chitinispirillales bacterium]
MNKSTLAAPQTVNQSGAVLYRELGGEIQILTVRSKTFPEQRIFPKGHIEDGESEELTAERELLEEAGMAGEIIGYAGQRSFDYRNKRYVVNYYAAHYISVDNEGEPGREPLWAGAAETRAFLPFDDLKEVLDSAIILMERHRRGRQNS